MIAVNWKSYEKYGCVNCGGDYCFSEDTDELAIAICTCVECKTKFFLMKDNLWISPVGYPIENYDGLIQEVDGESEKRLYDGYDLGKLLEDRDFKKINELKEKINKKGQAVNFDGYVYPFPQEHPRKGIAKHKYVSPVVKNGIGDFCAPIGCDYPFICTVKSKEAGQRINDMFNKIIEECGNKNFWCSLNYQDSRLDYFYVVVDFLDSLKHKFLAGLISENNNIITEDIVRKAITMKVDFASYWKYIACGRVYDNVEMNFMHRIIGNPGDFTRRQRDDIYHETWKSNNYLDQFEVWGAYKQINLELEKGNVENAIALARHLVDLSGDDFYYELMKQREQERGYITNYRENLYKVLVKSLNVHYENIGGTRIQYKGKQIRKNTALNDNFKLSEDMKQQFIFDWQSIISMIFDVVDLELLKIATIKEEEKNAEMITQEKQALNKYSNSYAIFSLFGLYVQVSRNIEEGNIENAVLATHHVASQMNSQLFNQLQTMANNDIYLSKIQTVYEEISNIASKYYAEQVEPGTPRKRTK